MRKALSLLILSLIALLPIAAQGNVSLRATAPSTVILDRPFQVVYTLNANGKDLRAPEFNNFDVLAGPFESRSQSYQIVNGKASSSVSVSYTFTLQAQKTGTFTIPSASITVEGDKITSNGLSIRVLPPDDPSAQNNAGGGGNAGSNRSSNPNNPAEANITSENLFIRTHLSRTRVFEQEAVLLTYKLYTLVDVVQCVNRNMPDFNGFMKQDLEQSTNKQFAYENYNGRNYGTVVLFQTLLFPQRSGEITIDRATFEAGIRVQNRSSSRRSIFDDFFDSYTNVSKTLTAPAVKINVDALPAGKPSDFSGTVGQFSMTGALSTNKTKANDAITLSITINGNGNMRLISNPKIEFPDGFETYDPKVSNNFKSTASGMSGTKVIEYMVIPRHAGSFEIPPVTFSYFDIQTKTYKTLRTQAFKIDVEKGDGTNTVVTSFTNKEDVKELGKDIRFIDTSNFKITKAQNSIVGRASAWLFYIIPLLIAVALFVVFRKRVIDNSDIGMVRNRKANRMATKRLKMANKLLLAGKKDAYYEELLKATWAYVADKLNISVAELTKEKVQTELLNKNIEQKLIDDTMDILNTCEFARYAPTGGQQEMGNLYEKTIRTISDIENNFK